MKLKGMSPREFRNRTIISLREQGKSQAEIASLVNCSQVWVSKVLKRYAEQGASMFEPKAETRGKKAALQAEQLAQLRDLLLQGALAHGFSTDNWTRKRVSQLIAQVFGVRHDPSHISRLLKKIGFSLQKPQAYSYRKDDQAVEKWKSHQLPNLKKS